MGYAKLLLIVVLLVGTCVVAAALPGSYLPDGLLALMLLAGLSFLGLELGASISRWKAHRRFLKDRAELFGWGKPYRADW